MPRFVVLRHDPPRGGTRPLHWDFMLESGGVLRTWALDRPPDEDAGVERFADALADHRIAYLEFEGEVSGGRGSVTRWDCGDYNAISWQANQIIVDLQGSRLHGRAYFNQIDSPSQRWRFTISPAPPPEPEVLNPEP